MPDHVSILKFIEAKWGSRRSPTAAATTAEPDHRADPTGRRTGRRSAIGDLIDLFNFKS
jgi:hypothetical protein